MLTAIYVALAGAAGSSCRHLIGVGLTRWSGRFPFGTFTVNVLGSFVIGMVMAMFAARGELDSRARIAITSGFLGGFTTYSAFAFETVNLIERDRAGMAALYVAATFAAAGLACWLGIVAGRGMR